MFNPVNELAPVETFISPGTWLTFPIFTVISPDSGTDKNLRPSLVFIG